MLVQFLDDGWVRMRRAQSAFRIGSGKVIERTFAQFPRTTGHDDRFCDGLSALLIILERLRSQDTSTIGIGRHVEEIRLWTWGMGVIRKRHNLICCSGRNFLRVGQISQVGEVVHSERDRKKLRR